MLTSAQGLMVYNLFRMPFVMSTLVRPVLSRYLHRFIVMPVQYLHDLLRLIGFTLDADIVCSRAKHHYDPQQGLDLSMSETMTNTTEAVTTLEKFRTAFRPTHERMKKLMYFC